MKQKKPDHHILIRAIGVISIAIFISGCKKDLTYDHIVYEVTPVAVYASNADKSKQKSPEQFISILYSNLTNKTLSGDALNNLSELSLSFGDKGLMNQMLLENFLANPSISIPSNDEMRSDIEEFVKETYLKFYLRNPTEYEKYYFKKLITDDTGITPEMIYTAFAESNEYLFY